MIRKDWRWLAVVRSLPGVWALALMLSSGAAALEPAARQMVQMQLRHRAPEQRAEAMRRLIDFPPLDAARILVQSGLSDPAPEVRRGAQESLLKLAQRSDVARFLLKTLDHPPHNSSTAPAASMIIALLAAAPTETQDEVMLRIVGSGGKSKISTAMLIDVADGLGETANPAAAAALHRLTTLARFPENFAFRRATVQALARVRQPDAIETLIDLLPKLYGEVRADVVRQLPGLTGQTHGENVDAWKAWWKAEKERFRFPDAQPAAQANNAVGAPGLSYYGLQIHARRMVFVIDVSGSMTGPRIQAAKQELINVLVGLPENAEFGLVTFSDRVRVWQPQLTVAFPANKQRAAQYVGYLQAGGMTAAYDALEAAFNFEAEAIYLLSDGQPTCGKIVEPGAIRAAVVRMNHLRRISIYTIGIAPGVPDSPLDTFLKKLAEENLGLYRRVD